jgi:hypothetical protein
MKSSIFSLLSVKSGSGDYYHQKASMSNSNQGYQIKPQSKKDSSDYHSFNNEASRISVHFLYHCVLLESILFKSGKCTHPCIGFSASNGTIHESETITHDHQPQPHARTSTASKSHCKIWILARVLYPV